jgi:hypothetical protein
MRPILLAFAAIAILGPAAAAAQGPGLSVADVLAKSDALEKKGMLAVFSSDLRVIRAEAQRDVDAFAGQLRSAHNAHRPLPACLPQDSSGWKLTFDTEEILKYYRSIPPQRRGMSSVEAFAEFMKVKYPCR